MMNTAQRHEVVTLVALATDEKRMKGGAPEEPLMKARRLAESYQVGSPWPEVIAY